MARQTRPRGARRRTTRLLPGLGCALLATAALAPPNAPAPLSLTGALHAQAPPDSPEVLRPGDVMRIQVWRQPEFSGEFPVTDRGEIAHPLYRELSVAGRPITEVEGMLAEFLTTYESNPSFVVEGRFRVAVGGEVRQPNVHLLPPGTTVAEAVALAGGIGDRGRLDRVILRRGDGEFRLDLTDPTARLREVTVRSGDEIVVERRRDAFREYIAPSASVIGAVAAVARLFM